jgi:periplasmic protein TonB
MSATLLASSAEEDAAHSDDSAASAERLAAALPSPSRLSSWLAPAPRSAFSTRELGGILLVSALLHAGVATAAYRRDKAAPPKHISRVEIEVTRRPERPKPATPVIVPPTAPKLVKHETRPLAVNERPAEPTPAPPTDTGSSAPAEEGGELHAGSGGLGVEPPAPPTPPALVVVPGAPPPTVQAREGANYLKNPRPAYPRQAKREGLEGTTLLRIWVQASGKPGSINVQQSSGHELLDDAAKEAVSKWTFAAATQGGVAVGGFVTVPIVFRLQ